MGNVKKCSKCGLLKSKSEYNKDMYRKDGIRLVCKKCDNSATLKYNRTKVGLVHRIYNSQTQKSKVSCYSPPSYTRKELKQWMFSQKIFHELYDDWVNSGYDKMMSPSCDRIDDYESYTLNNIQLMTWKDNKKKACSDIKNGINNKQSKAVVGEHKVTGEIVEFYSMSQAQRESGICHSDICRCCMGKSNSAGGYYWSYKNII